MPHILHPRVETGIQLTVIVAVLPSLLFDGLCGTAEARDAALRHTTIAGLYGARPVPILE